MSRAGVFATVGYDEKSESFLPRIIIRLTRDLQEECEMVKKIPALLALSLLTWPLAWADDDDHGSRFPRDATFFTLVLTALTIESLTRDDHRNLYTDRR